MQPLQPKRPHMHLYLQHSHEHFPVMQASPVASSSQSHQTVSETISRGSSAILDEIADLDSFAPDTPPQNAGLLAAECSSEYDPHAGMSSMCH